MPNQPVRRLTSFTPKPIGALNEQTVETVATAIHKRAVNNLDDRGGTTALFVDNSGMVYALFSDSLTADIWFRDRPQMFIAVIDPGRPQYSLTWLISHLRESMNEGA